MNVSTEDKISIVISIVLFSGGRGTANISRTFLRYPHIRLTVLVNAYDDGLSTGQIREFIPGMLGPSDIRKNIINLMRDDEECYRSLKTILKYRLPVAVSFDEGMKIVQSFKLGDPRQFPRELAEACRGLTLKQLLQIKDDLDEFIRYTIDRKDQGIAFDFGDTNIGNILFAGRYLRQGKDFNRTIDSFCRFCEVRGEILNITDGTNKILVALKQNGTFLKRESEIVSTQDNHMIHDIYLLDDYLSEDELHELSSLSFNKKETFLRQHEVFPHINTVAANRLRDADVIVFGPGTQYSSLFPSYLTQGAAEAILENRQAEKVFISNIHKDYDIQNETVNSLLKRFLYYHSRKNTTSIKLSDAANHLFIQRPGDTSAQAPYLSFDDRDLDVASEEITLMNWEEAKGKHHGGVVLNELLAIVERGMQKRLQPFHHTVSIIVPGLNESGTVQQVLHQLTLLDFQQHEMSKEIIFVDGGSTDGTFELAKAVSGITALQLPKKLGRGAALKYGIEHARGDLAVFFPSDGEYHPECIFDLIGPILEGSVNIVFGSRSIKCLQIDDIIKRIYEGNLLLYFFSKYGGLLLSTVSLFRHNHFVSDPLTTVKAFKTSTLKELNLQRNGTGFEGELIAKASAALEFIFEVPVEYLPRKKKQGKKMSVWQGLQVLWSLMASGRRRKKI